MGESSATKSVWSRTHFGNWGWFFGRDRAFVEEQIARFSGELPDGGTSASNDSSGWHH